MKNNIIHTFGYVVAVASIVLPATTFAAIYGSTDSNVGIGVGSGVQVKVQEDTHTSASSSNSASTESSKPETSDNNINASINGIVHMNREDARNNTTVEITSANNVSSDNDTESYARSVIKSDNKVESVSVGTSTVTVSYDVPAKFFGFIPVTIMVTAQADETGTVDISYPWYAFLIKTSNSAALHASAEAKAHAAAQSAVTSSAQIKAALIDALHTAFKTQVESETSASVGK